MSAGLDRMRGPDRRYTRAGIALGLDLYSGDALSKALAAIGMLQAASLEEGGPMDIPDLVLGFCTALEHRGRATREQLEGVAKRLGVILEQRAAELARCGELAGIADECRLRMLAAAEACPP